MKKIDTRALIPPYLANSKSFSVAVTDLDGNYSFVNATFEKAFNFLKVDLIGQHFHLLTHPKDIEKCNAAAQACIDYPGKLFQLQVRKPEHSHDDFYLTNWEFSLLCDDDQQPLGILCIGSDVSELARVNLQVDEFSKKLDALIDEITDGFYTLNHDYEIVKINKIAEQTLGFPKNELLGRKIWDIFPGDFPKCKYPTLFKRCMTEYVTLNFEEYHAASCRWFNIICYPNHEGLTVFFKDITEDKEIQEELKNSKFKLKAILDSTSDGNILISPDYKILCFNKQAAEVCEVVFGKPLSESEDVWDYVITDDKADFLSDTQKAFKGEYLKFEREIFFKGGSCWFEVSYFPVYESDGSILGVTFNTTNIDGRKKSEIKIQQSEVMLRSLHNSSDAGLTFLDQDFKILFNNEEAKKITRSLYGKVSSIGDDALDYYAVELREEFKRYFQRVINGEKITLEKEHFDKWWRFSFFPVYDAENKIVGISQNVKNITTQKQSDLKIHQQNEKLKTIAWQQCHEVRGPLSNILGLCESLAATRDQKDIGQHVSYILQSSQDLDQIIQTIVSKATEEE